MKRWALTGVLTLSACGHHGPLNRHSRRYANPIGHSRAEVIAAYGPVVGDERGTTARAPCRGVCDEIVVFHGLEVALKDGASISARWTFGRDDSLLLPRLRSITRFDFFSFTELASGNPYQSPASVFAWTDDRTREIALANDGVEWRVAVDCRPVVVDRRITRPPMAGEYRIVSLDVGPGRVLTTRVAAAPAIVGRTLDEAKHLLSARRGLAHSDPLPFGPTRFDGRGMNEIVVVETSNGVVSRATWEWEGDDHSRFSFGDPLVIGSDGLPTKALQISSAQEFKIENASDFLERTYEWRRDGQLFQATVFCPPVHGWIPRLGIFVDRVSRFHEYRVKRLVVRKETSADAKIPEASLEIPKHPDLDVPPRFRRNASPGFNSIARALSYQATVVLAIEVAEDGTVREVTVERDVPFFVRDSIRAVSSWMYEPLIIDGEATDWHSRVNLNFRLR